MTSAKKSTIVRFYAGVFPLLERVAPPVGAKLLDQLWFRLPTVPEKVRRPRVELPAATPFELPFEGGLIRGQVYGDAGPLVYLVHGWGGWGLQLAAFVPPLVEAGFRVVAYDAPSHGDSAPGLQGKGRSTMPEIADAFQAVVADRGPAYGVIAHSLGAAAVTHALLHFAEPERVVFVAAATDFAVTLDAFQAAFGFGPRVRAGFLRRFARRFGPMESYEGVRAVTDLAARRALPPLLAIHDRDDRETEADGSIRVTKVWPGATVELTEGLGHRRILRDPAVIELALGFLSTDREAGDTPRTPRETMGR
ncbi:alpha/beta fold hydrolase [Kribbella sp. CA-253562]|uniref:alpha/beta fold hydrolase n=1 Tax=Kribbella sp. CA-253562 TaxID=3239942 RepID=UPI003D8E7B58